MGENPFPGVHIEAVATRPEPVMRKLLFVAAALAAVMWLGDRQSHAYQDAPWCAMMMIGTGSVVERCDYWNLETCTAEVISGNRGFCNQNPSWSGYYKATSAKPKSKSSRKRAR
jgi:hypothetical protein